MSDSGLCKTKKVRTLGRVQRSQPLKLRATDPEEKKTKAKDVKRKGVVVLAAEPDTKHGRDQPESSKGNRPFCAYHNLHTHNTNDC